MSTPQMSVPTTAGDGQGTGPGDPVPPFTAEEWDSIQSTIWGDLEGDPFRIADLLSTALGTVAGIALDGQTAAAALCVRTLREMEQRALWGPDHEQEDHR